MTKQTSPSWTAQDIPDQRGRTAVITGANTGIGFETARVLAEKGATVVLACRDPGKAEAAAARIRVSAPEATVRTQTLDLASLASIHTAAAELRSDYPRLDLLINNAGVMIPPYSRTEDGFELQFGTNHLGHFALTGLLLDRLLPVPGARIVTVSSTGHRAGRINFDDLQWTKRYRAVAAYGQSKLANLMFTYELQRRLAAAGERAIAVAVHPGGVATELQRYSALHFRAIGFVLLRLFGQSETVMGALPSLRAATDPRVEGGTYYGPDGPFEWSGHPTRVSSSARSLDTDVRRRLWQESEQLTGITYPWTEVSTPRPT